jgi:hypothetical protein
MYECGDTALGLADTFAPITAPRHVLSGGGKRGGLPLPLCSNKAVLAVVVVVAIPLLRGGSGTKPKSMVGRIAGHKPAFAAHEGVRAYSSPITSGRSNLLLFM